MLPPPHLLLSRTRTYYRSYGFIRTVRKVASSAFAIFDLRLARQQTITIAQPPAIAVGSNEARYRQPQLPTDFRERCGRASPRVLFVRARDVAAPAARDWGAQGPVVAFVYDVDVAIARLEAGEIDVLVLKDVELTDEVRRLLLRAHARHIPSAYYLESIETIDRKHVAAPADGSEHPWAVDHGAIFGRLQAMRACTFALSATQAIAELAKRNRAHVVEVPNWDDLACGSGTIWTALLQRYLRLQRPSVSIVTILYNKAAEIPWVLGSYFEQTYDGEIEVVLVDDQSPDDSIAVVESVVSQRKTDRPGSRFPEIRIVKNDRNLGNCISRNRGIRVAKGDIIFVMDADCAVNRDFILRHVEAHAFGDCEVVVGPMNIETNGTDSRQLLSQYQYAPGLASEHAALQDRINRTSFLNCVTRNFSIKREAITGDLFDSLFAYSADPASGFGWEDVEMGYRLYKRGARIKYVEEAVSIHISAPHEGSEHTKPARSMKNFRRLFEKHPELALVTRRWARETFGNICAWADTCGIPPSEDRQWLSRLLGDNPQGFSVISAPKRYRVLTYRWHVPHQYELYKLPFDFTLMTGLGSPMTDGWEYSQRPMPRNVRLKSVNEVNVSDYDFAILHFDENVLSPENTNGVIGPDWGKAFQWFRENVDLPKVAICHGTPQFFGQYNIDYEGPDLLQVIEQERAKMVEYLGDIPVVCNSHQAAHEWQFSKSLVIWHGFDPAEFPPATYEKGIVSPLGPLVLSRPHYRGYFLYRKVFDGFYDELSPETLRVPEPHVLYSGNAYAQARYWNYVDEIRRYSVYFNPTLRSPMPRARAEPMMCGVVTVSARNHDVDLFIKNGINGFYADDPHELRDQLRFLIRNPDQTRRIGAAGRTLAMDVFNHDRFLGDWMKLVGKLVG